jgi:hypothetical protein
MWRAVWLEPHAVARRSSELPAGPPPDWDDLARADHRGPRPQTARVSRGVPPSRLAIGPVKAAAWATAGMPYAAPSAFATASRTSSSDGTDLPWRAASSAREIIVTPGRPQAVNRVNSARSGRR